MQTLRPLTSAPPEPSSEVRLGAESREKNRSQAVIGSAEHELGLLTPLQRDMLSAVEDYIAARGYPPSLGELMLVTGNPSKNGVAQHLDALDRKGYIAREVGVRRGITVLVSSAQARVAVPRPIRKAAFDGVSTAELEAELRRRARRIG